MKTPGIIGGIGPESTIEYYRLIVASYRERRRDGSYPRVLIHTIDLQRMLALVAAGRQDQLADMLLDELHALLRAGADFAALAANTPHVVFAALRARSPLPLISIVSVTSDAAGALGLRRLGLLGTRFTMEGRFFPDGFAAAGIELVTPSPTEQTYVHEKYMGELVAGVVLPETRAGLLAIVERLRREEGIEGLVLGGTELSLILRDQDVAGIPLLDTTRLHSRAIVDAMLA